LIIAQLGLFQRGIETGYFVGHVVGIATAKVKLTGGAPVVIVKQPEMRPYPTLRCHVGVEGDAISEFVPTTNIVDTGHSVTAHYTTIAYFHGGGRIE
jgi:hypothetical protein